jgi:hypothetical protein
MARTVLVGVESVGDLHERFTIPAMLLIPKFAWPLGYCSKRCLVVFGGHIGCVGSYNTHFIR